MRLSKRLQSLIKEAIAKSFGEVDVYLFGSRTDERKVGGDIDLALDIDINREEFRRKKAHFLVILVRQGFDIKMDIVQYNQKDKLLYEEIANNSIQI